MQANKLPTSYVCGKELLEAYSETEKKILPFLKKHSRRVASAIPEIDYEDALQEGRIAIVVALANVDVEKNGGLIAPYIYKVVRNCYYGMVSEAMFKSRVPHVVDFNSDGEKIIRPLFPISLDTMVTYDDGEMTKYEIPDSENIPSRNLEEVSVKTELGIFAMKMYNKLTGTDREIFRCKVHPSSDFLDMLYLDGVDYVHRDDTGKLVMDENFEITPDQISKYLGITKNSVGWSLYKIRKLFVDLSRNDKTFNETINSLVIDKRWPHLHVSEKSENEDLEFKRNIFKRRCLCTKQRKEPDYSESKRLDADGKPFYYRMIKWYDWGAVINIKYEKDYYTVIAEGRFNPLTGAVFGSVYKDAQVHIPLKWYRKMAKELVQDERRI